MSIFVNYPEGHPDHCVLCMERYIKKNELNSKVDNEFQEETKNSQSFCSSDASLEEGRTDEGQKEKRKNNPKRSEWE